MYLMYRAFSRCKTFGHRCIRKGLPKMPLNYLICLANVRTENCVIVVLTCRTFLHIFPACFLFYIPVHFSCIAKKGGSWGTANIWYLRFFSLLLKNLSKIKRVDIHPVVKLQLWSCRVIFLQKNITTRRNGHSTMETTIVPSYWSVETYANICPWLRLKRNHWEEHCLRWNYC